MFRDSQHLSVDTDTGREGNLQRQTQFHPSETAAPAGPLLFFLAAMQQPKKLRVLCLHSWRTSGDIFVAQWRRAGLDAALADLLELVSARQLLHRDVSTVADLEATKAASLLSPSHIP